jgi:hypothetical protein
LELLKSLFGPNSTLRFSFKRHQALFKAIAENLKSSDIKSYLQHLKAVYSAQDLDEFYPSRASAESDEDDKEEEDEEEEEKAKQNKKDNIRVYALNQIVNVIQIFKV